MNGTHLMEKYLGTLLVPCACEGRNNIIPIGLANVELESKETWTARELPIVVLVEKTRTKLTDFFFSSAIPKYQMTTSVIPQVLFIVQELDEK